MTAANTAIEAVIQDEFFILYDDYIAAIAQSQSNSAGGLFTTGSRFGIILP
jgi:hypothetical protein